MKLPVFKRGVRVKPKQLRAAKERKLEEKKIAEVLEKVRAHFAEFLDLLADDSDVADHILAGRSPFEVWVRRALIKRREAMETTQPESAEGRPEERN